MPPPRACPECKEEDSLVPVGPGVERIADEVKALFPDARTAIVTSDTIWSPAKAAEFVGRMEAGDIDIVIGTQLVTKRSEEHTSELQSLMRISYAVFCLKKKTQKTTRTT